MELERLEADLPEGLLWLLSLFSQCGEAADACQSQKDDSDKKNPSNTLHLKNGNTSHLLKNDEKVVMGARNDLIQSSRKMDSSLASYENGLS